MDSRERLHRTLSFSGGVAPPRYENEFHEDVVKAWTAQGLLNGLGVEEYFRLDRRDTVAAQWRPAASSPRKRFVVEIDADFEAFCRLYDPDRAVEPPDGWDARVAEWRGRDFALTTAPWGDGFLQLIGIADWSSFVKAIALLCEQPARVEAMMERYAEYLERAIDRLCAALGGVTIDYALFYEAIASNHAPVLSPEMYARYALPALRRVVARLDRHGVAYRFMRTSGQVRALIPLWLDAGVNGLYVTQTAVSGASYMSLRRDVSARILLLGGVDCRAVTQGAAAMDDVLRRTVRPLLEQGGYVPYLDDRIRPHISFAQFCAYRQKLDAMTDAVYGIRA